MAVNKELIEDATLTYLHSYNVALQATKNPNLAIQAAMSVTNSMVNIMSQQTKQMQPMDLFRTFTETLMKQKKRMRER